MKSSMEHIWLLERAKVDQEKLNTKMTQLAMQEQAHELRQREKRLRKEAGSLTERLANAHVVSQQAAELKRQTQALQTQTLALEARERKNMLLQKEISKKEKEIKENTEVLEAEQEDLDRGQHELAKATTQLLSDRSGLEQLEDQYAVCLSELEQQKTQVTRLVHDHELYTQLTPLLLSTTASALDHHGHSTQQARPESLPHLVQGPGGAGSDTVGHEGVNHPPNIIANVAPHGVNNPSYNHPPTVAAAHSVPGVPVMASLGSLNLTITGQQQQQVGHVNDPASREQSVPGPAHLGQNPPGDEFSAILAELDSALAVATETSQRERALYNY